MNSLLLLLPLLAAQTEAPPPPTTTPPPVLRMEGTTNAQPAPKPAPGADAPVVTPAPATTAHVPGSRGAPVFLTIHSNRPDLLLIRGDNGEAACTVPCDRLVPAGPKDSYYLGGKGLTNSNDFDLAEGIKAARIEVHAGTKAGKIAGIILTAVGAPFFLGGGLGMISWGILQDPKVQAQLASSGGSTTSWISPTASLVLALIELAVGAGSLTTGLILWPTNATTVQMLPAELPEPASAPVPAVPAPAPPAAEPAPAGT